jgi:hypothetical protein
MITEEQHKDATEKSRWDRFYENNEYFKDDELVYSSESRCEKCGAVMACPKECYMLRQWICSAVLKGIVTDDNHSAIPFEFYKLKERINLEQTAQL